MIRPLMVSALILGTLAAPAMADINAMGQKDGCFVCHGINNKIVGPSWKDIAKKYRGDKAAQAKLIVKVKSGGGGVWGDIPMPPNSPRVSDDDIKALVKGILALK